MNKYKNKNQKIKYYKIKIPIIRKNYKKTQACKFKGNIFIISNQYGIIYAWKIIFSKIYLDLYTTPSWFFKKSLNFQRRQKLFELLNLKQEARPTKSKNKLIKLNERQIKKVNNFFNDSTSYNSTIKNIIGILKGNNPGGEAQNPISAEMIINNKSNIKNFVIIFDDLTIKNNHNYNYDFFEISSTKLKLKEFVKLNNYLEEAFKYMQKNKKLDDWINYLNSIKKYYKKYNIHFQKANQIAAKYRSRFSKNIDNQIHFFPFNFKSKDQFQKCHIYEFHILRDKIVEAIRNEKSYKKYCKMIEDPNNFLPLPEAIHRKFDQNYFTYKQNGIIYAINIKGSKFIDKNIKKKYQKIAKNFLNEKRCEYFALRNTKKF